MTDCTSLSIHQIPLVSCAGQGIKPLRNVYITNGKEDAVVALWEREAENFDANRYMNMASQGPVAFLFIAMTSRMFEVT